MPTVKLTKSGSTNLSLVAVAGLLLMAQAACSQGGGSTSRSSGARSPSTSAQRPSPFEPSNDREADERKAHTASTDPDRPSRPASPPWLTPTPDWLGRRVLPERPDGFGVVRATPRILRNRRFATVNHLPPPNGGRFTSTISAVPPSVAKRSTWRKRCPVPLDELSYLTMSFWGFDREHHTGEMIVNESVAHQVVGVFRKLFRAKFPIEEMRVVTRHDLRAPPTGDTNNTTSYSCRRTTQAETWSEHSYGLAIDINPFHNPYMSGDLVAPERASAYMNRAWRRPGMIFEGNVVTDAFDALGWEWGGRWDSLKDWMHFSRSGH
jgi:hypothetical protein